VEDAWQHRGLGRRLTARLALLAATRGIDAFVATMLPDNRAALGLVRKLSPEADVHFAGGEYEAFIPLPHAS
jgi:ribosomal protein S18 acetylase RimI-like enzyme